MERSEIKGKILELLVRNGRMSSSEVGDRLELSVNEVDALIKELERDNVILGYSAIVSENGLGDKVRAIIEVEVQPERDTGFDTIAEKLGKFPEVRSMYLVSGRYDLRLEVLVNSLQEVASFVSGKLACQEGVKSTATYFMLKKYKESGIQFSQGEKNERLKIVP